ncbi:MAG: hypothetical protein K8S54_10525 [Spirochaetia bacterium]|nr:hypothetical protein [Spirochaetia bacterium]
MALFNILILETVRAGKRHVSVPVEAETQVEALAKLPGLTIGREYRVENVLTPPEKGVNSR